MPRRPVDQETELVKSGIVHRQRRVEKLMTPPAISKNSYFDRVHTYFTLQAAKLSEL